MESATTTSTVIVIVFIDTAQSATVLFRLHQGTATILNTLNQTTTPCHSAASLLSGTSQLCRSVDGFEKQNRQRIRIRSCLFHNISTEARQLLDRLERISLQVHRRSSAPTKRVGIKSTVIFEKRRKISKGATWAHRNVVLPSQLNNKSPREPTAPECPVTARSSAILNSRMLQEALEVFFHNRVPPAQRISRRIRSAVLWDFHVCHGPPTERPVPFRARWSHG